MRKITVRRHDSDEQGLLIPAQVIPAHVTLMPSNGGPDTGDPEDPCGRCGCRRKYHKPPKSEMSMRWRVGQKGGMVKVDATTCCHGCPHCICFCTGFIEPFAGQKYSKCVYERKKIVVKRGGA